MADYAQIQEKFGGNWVLERSENFTEFLKAMDVGMIARKAAESATPKCEISVEGSKISITTKAIKSKTETFALDEEFETENNGNTAKVKATFEDGKLKTTIIEASKKKVPNTLRYIDGDKMVFELHIDDIVCKRIFKRQ